MKQKVHSQQCPICGALTKIWEDRWQVINWSGCLHVENLVNIEGTMQLEFTIPRQA